MTETGHRPLPRERAEDTGNGQNLDRNSEVLNLLINSTGIKVEGEGEWHARKHGGPKRRVWRKVHLGIDEHTLEVRAVELTGSHIRDTPVLPDLLRQITSDQEIGSVTADGAYDTRRCHDAIADQGAHAVIPLRRNAKPWKPTTAGAIARNNVLRSSKYLGRAIWRHWRGYHRRSRAETKMHCMKMLGQRLIARDFDRQIAEVQVRVAIMNGYTALCIPVKKTVEQAYRRKGQLRPSPDLRNRAAPGAPSTNWSLGPRVIAESPIWTIRCQADHQDFGYYRRVESSIVSQQFLARSSSGSNSWNCWIGFTSKASAVALTKRSSAAAPCASTPKTIAI